MPTSRRGHERSRHGEQRIPVERAGRVALEQVLHDIGGVRADHQEFAVRHVDDADQPVRDREAERGEQQHAAERQAREQRARNLAAPLDRIEFVDAALARRRARGRRFR